MAMDEAEGKTIRGEDVRPAAGLVLLCIILALGCAQDEKPAVAAAGDLTADGVDKLQARIKELEAKAKALPTNKPHQIAASSAILNDLKMAKIEVTARKNPLLNTLPEPTHKRVLEILMKVESGIANFPTE